MTAVRTKTSWALLIVGLCCAVSWGQGPRLDIYFAQEIWTGQGDPIRDAAMVVEDGKVISVGARADISIPATAVVHELGDQVIIPGLVGAKTQLSGATDEERTLTPEIRALDGFDFFADRSGLLKAGITTVQVSPGRARLMPGVGGVVQLVGESISSRVLSDSESLRIVLTSSSRNPPRIYEPPVGPVSEDRPLMTTRPQLSTLSASLAGLRQILRQATADETFAMDRESDELVMTVANLIQNKVPLRIAATSAPEIRGAVELAKEFDVKIILEGCLGLEPFAMAFERWHPHVAGVVMTGISPGQITNPSADQIKQLRFPWTHCRGLLDAGIPIAIAPANDSDLAELMFVAGQFMQGELTATELLAALTSTPAKLMRVDTQIGSLAPGKRADFVVLNDRPFRLHTRVRATYAAGNPAYSHARTRPTTVIKAGRIYLGDGQYLDDAAVVVKGKTVRGIGSSVSAPADADVKSYGNAVIVPGYVDLGAGLGLGGPLRGQLPLQTKLGDQLYAGDPAIAFARRNGVTTALLGLTSSPQPSPVVAFKLGDDARVISDPIAIRFKLSGDTAAGIASNEKSLKAGKAYADSWTKYEKDLAAFEAEAKNTKPAETTKKTEEKVDVKKPDSDSNKESASKEKKKEPEQPKPKPKKESVEKKEPEKEPEKKEKKKKPLPDPITGTWEGELDNERLPPQFRTFTLELELTGTEVTGNVQMLRSKTDISTGSFDRESRELTLTLERRGTEVTISGQLDESGAFSGEMELGRMGTVALSASRTVDKSKKPEVEKEEVEQETPEKKEKTKEKKPEKKDEPKKEKPASDPIKDADKKEKPDGAKEKDDSKKSPEKDSEKVEPEKKPAPKPPKKPRVNAALEPYRALFDGEIPAFVESKDLNSIKAAAELFSKKYQLRTVIVGADDMAREPGLLDGYDVSVCAGPNFSATVDKQPPTNLPQLFSNEGLMFGFQSSGTTGSGQLPAAIQFAVSRGLSATDALQALTVDAADLLSKDLNFGRLATGKDADLVVLSGDPFEFSTRVLAVMIDGRWVYEYEEAKQ